MKTIVALSGSLRPGSASTALVQAIAALAPADTTVVLYSGLVDLPPFLPYTFGEVLPPTVQAFQTLLQSADGVIISTPEYAHGMPGSLKNALDWVVTSGEMWRKPVAAISSAPGLEGGARAHAWLLQTLQAVEAAIVADASRPFPFIRTKLDAQGNVADPETIEELRSVLGALLDVIDG